jgi:cytochrome P450
VNTGEAEPVASADLPFGFDPLSRVFRSDPSRTSLFFENPPDHGRLRGLVSRAFTPNAIERVRRAAREAAAP